jgi:hypothetical protein
LVVEYLMTILTSSPLASALGSLTVRGSPMASLTRLPTDHS